MHARTRYQRPVTDTQLVPERKRRLWFPSSKPLLTLTDRPLTRKVNSMVFFLPKALRIIKKVSQTAKKKKKRERNSS